jgi:hypothetical protein
MFPATDGQLDLAFEHETEFLALMLEVAPAAVAGREVIQMAVSIEGRRMHYRHLYYFVRIVEAGSFSQASRTIHVAQPALSQQIAELEASLGLPLLQRSARG